MRAKIQTAVASQRTIIRKLEGPLAGESYMVYLPEMSGTGKIWMTNVVLSHGGGLSNFFRLTMDDLVPEIWER